VSAPRILLVSNGFGEVAVLECVARAVRDADATAILAHMRLVGRAGGDAWPPVVGPAIEMPSGGLVTYWNVRNIWRDVRAGLLGATLRQFAFLRAQRSGYDVVVAVGDAYCLAACRWFARLPTVFVATAKSEFVAKHSPLECAIARGAAIAFARDAATADALARAGVNARYAGNVMMDDLAPGFVALPVDERALRIAVLPGSRADAPDNAAASTRRLMLIGATLDRSVQALVALAPSADSAAIATAIDGAGVAVSPTGASSGIVARGSRGRLEMLLVRGGFGDVLRASEIVLGQAGTGNEQAAGLGKPVIAAAERGRRPDQVGWYRMRQKRLLGDALLVLPDADVDFASGAVALLRDAQRMAAMSAAGRARMGETGAAAAIATAILNVARSHA